MASQDVFNSNELPLVSIVIPTYNAGHLLERAVRSADRQSYGNIEIVIVDDCSTDDSIDGIQEKFPSVRIERTDTNSGSPARPRNIGCQVATGSWVAFLDSDDYWLPNKLEFQLAAVRQNSTLACSTNAIRRTNESGETGESYLPKPPRFTNVKSLIEANWIVTSSILIEKKILNEVLPFPENGPTIYEDYAVWLRLVRLTELTFLNEARTFYSDEPQFSFRSQHLAHLSMQNTFNDFSNWLLNRGQKLTIAERLTCIYVKTRSHAHSILNHGRMESNTKRD